MAANISTLVDDFSTNTIGTKWTVVGSIGAGSLSWDQATGRLSVTSLNAGSFAAGSIPFTGGWFWGSKNGPQEFVVKVFLPSDATSSTLLRIFVSGPESVSFYSTATPGQWNINNSGTLVTGTQFWARISTYAAGSSTGYQADWAYDNNGAPDSWNLVQQTLTGNNISNGVSLGIVGRTGYNTTVYFDNANVYSGAYTGADTTAPTVPTISSVNHSGNSVTVAWNSNSDVATYEIFRNGISQGTVSGTTFTQTVSDGTYSYTVRAKDAANNWSAQSGAVSTGVIDNTAPITPSTPTLVLAATPSRTVTVSWTAVSDAALYEVFLDSVSQGTQTATSRVINAVTDGTHTVTVRAQDAAGNWSTVSTAGSITVDRTPPAVPATPASVPVSHTGSATISWTSTPGAVQYEVLRNGASVETTASTSYTEVVVPGTYSYTVRSQDSDGNWSDPSTPITVTVESIGLHAPPAIKTGTESDLDYSVGQREFPDEDNIRFDRE